jgi:hypothetical protein
MTRLLVLLSFLAGCAHVPAASTQPDPHRPLSVAVVGPEWLQGPRPLPTRIDECRQGPGGDFLACGAATLFSRFTPDDVDHADWVVHADYLHVLPPTLDGPVSIVVRVDDRRSGKTLIRMQGNATVEPGLFYPTVATMLEGMRQQLNAYLHG